MNKPYTGFLIPADHQKPMQKIHIDPAKDNLAQLLGANKIDVAIGGKKSVFLIDDEQQATTKQPINHRATTFYFHQLKNSIATNQIMIITPSGYIKGNALLISGTDDEGNKISVSDELIDSYLNLLPNN